MFYHLVATNRMMFLGPLIEDVAYSINVLIYIEKRNTQNTIDIHTCNTIIRQKKILN